MPADLPIKCACGKLRGVARDVRPQTVNRVACYCNFCQSYAHWLGRAEQVLDEQGGTDIFQLSPANFEITEGQEHIACVRLTPKGPMRWHAGCCKTPLSNTFPHNRQPFMGIVHDCVDFESTGRGIDDWLGPIAARVNHKFPKSEQAALKATRGAMFGMALRLMWMMLRWRLAGAQKKLCFFDGQTGAPVAEAQVLSSDERKALREAAA